LPPSITPSYIDLVRGLPLTQLSLLWHADFPRAVDILLEGYRLVNGDARSAKGYEGLLSCHTGGHEFAFTSIWGENS